jgi:hypothetical protein
LEPRWDAGTLVRLLTPGALVDAAPPALVEVAARAAGADVLSAEAPCDGLCWAG